MKPRIPQIVLLISLGISLACCKPSVSDADHLVILHTNDTHSSIDPDRHDNGGIARRKVVIDSVRNARTNVMLVDAGDAVQGSLYFTIFGGEVERALMNELGYDIRILGNHEFDHKGTGFAEMLNSAKAAQQAAVELLLVDARPLEDMDTYLSLIHI